MDIYIPVKFKKGKFSAMLIPHFFQSAGKLYRQERNEEWIPIFNEDETPVMKEFGKYLGTEIDFAAGYTFSKAVAIKAGYSMMFVSETMQYLKETQKDTGNRWGWVMLIFKPTFYTNKK
jgi:choline-glycine betaine transporter